MENATNNFGLKNNSQRPKTTINKNLKFSKNRGFSSSSNDFFPSIYRQKLFIQFNNNKNNNNSNNFSNTNYYFWDKEKLFDKCMKLQNELNFLNQQYKFQKVENKKQNQLIKKQNVILNKYNNISNYFYSPNILENEKHNIKNNNENNINYELNDKNNNKENIEIENIIDDKIKEIKKSSSNINNNLEKEKENSNKKIMKKSKSDFYNTNIKKNQIKKNQILKIKIAGETLISNLKIRCKQLTKENKEKDDLIKDMKKNMKLSNINELQKENSIYESEIQKMKNKLFEAYDKIFYYEKKESQMKLLFEQLKKKDKKINILEQENNKLVNQYESILNELQRDNDLKYKKILNQENIIKKLYVNEKNKEKNSNLNSKRELSEKEEKEIKDIINNNNNTNQDKKKEIQLNKELKIIREGKKNDNNNNNNILKRFKGIEEFYHLYIEMKKKGINSPENFFSYSINTLSENLSIDENIIIYADGIIKLLGIKTKEERSIVLDYANKFFKNIKNVNLLKEKQTYIMNEIFKEEKN